MLTRARAVGERRLWTRERGGEQRENKYCMYHSNSWSRHTSIQPVGEAKLEGITKIVETTQ